MLFKFYLKYHAYVVSIMLVNGGKNWLIVAIDAFKKLFLVFFKGKNYKAQDLNIDLRFKMHLKLQHYKWNFIPDFILGAQ